ncbi:MAG: hypothetical protein JSW71_12760 [Gemmatimonadota bacterium]|nr:MAG: hypothetical protein JSW71_12760 [Gemmatimonadota bacterium]
MSAVALSADPSGKMAVMTLCGALGTKDVDAAVGLLCRSAHCRPGVGIIWDLQRAEIDMTPREVITTVRYLAHRPGARGSRHAVVAARDLDYGLARAAQAYAEAWLEAEFMVFRDRGDAERWLEEASGKPLG